MRVGTPKSGEALRGKTILLLASVPTEGRSEQYSHVDDAAFEIEQAVISLARAVFSEGGPTCICGSPVIFQYVVHSI